VGHDHPTFCQEHVLQPDGVADDVGREAVAVIGGGLGRHLDSLAQLVFRRQQPLMWQCRHKRCRRGSSLLTQGKPKRAPKQTDEQGSSLLAQGNSWALTGQVFAMGSSLLVQGKQRAEQRIAFDVRFIPARAGETRADQTGPP
jgi:hypothetical protein